MIRERGKGATAEEIARALQVLARAADTRKSYPSDHPATVRAMSDLSSAFESLLAEMPEVILDVTPEALSFQGQKVLEGTAPESSLPLALHRDGIRRIAFSRGITPDELEIVVNATAQGLAFGGLGDDLVAALWRNQLRHVRYGAVDTSIDAAGERAARVRSEVEGVMASLAAVELDPPSDEPFQPAPSLVSAPAYRDELVKELEPENEHAVAERAARVMTRAWKEARREEDAERLAAKLLEMFDAALVNDDARLATSITRCVRTLHQGADRVADWLKEASSETRLRRLVPMLEGHPNRHDEVLALIDAIGRPAVPALFALQPALTEITTRRALSERIVRHGVEDLGPVKEMINREPVYLAQEAIFILGRVGTPEAQSAIRDARVHPKLHVRLALVESLRHVPAELALTIALDLLNKEEEPKVLAATARSLPRYKTKETADALEAAAQRLADRPLPYETKLAILSSFSAVSSARALPLLARYIKRGEGLLVRRDAEELAAAAVRALGSIRGQRTNELVEKAAQSRSKMVKEAAREVLHQARGEAN